MIATPSPAADKPRSLDELRATVSASRLNTWLSCRLKFYFRYVLGLTKPRRAALYVGHTVHGVLKLWNQARWRRQVLTVADLRQRFDGLWLSDQQTVPVKWDDDEEASEQQTAWSLLDLYFRASPIPPNELPEAVEVSAEADLTQHGLPKLIGILDLVRAGGRIVDYKMSARPRAMRRRSTPTRCNSAATPCSTGPTPGRPRVAATCTSW